MESTVTTKIAVFFPAKGGFAGYHDASMSSENSEFEQLSRIRNPVGAAATCRRRGCGVAQKLTHGDSGICELEI